MTRRSGVGLVVLSLILFCSVALRAQDVASITGVVTDQTGAVLPGVDVTLENPQTGAKYTATTSSDGSYTINQVKPGPGYKIEFNHEGFSGTVFFGVYMNVDTTRTQNAKLALGKASETVEVSATSENVTLDTTDATIGNNFQVQILNDMPIQNRSNPSALFVQQPGVTLDGAVTGARVDQSRVTVDGLDVNDMATGNFGTIIGSAPVDSVQEFRGVTAGELSSANGGGGGEFELVTKSGTNSFHGALVEYHRDTALEANDWFNNNAGVPRPPLIRNQFGGNVGGPIIKDKLFFFFDYNARRDTLSNLVNRIVPLDSFRDKNIQYIDHTGGVSVLDAGQVAALDPQGVGFNQNLIDLFNSRYPHSNNTDTGDGLNTGGFRFNAPFPYKESDYVTRIDYNLNSKMKLYGNFTTNRITGTESSNWFPGDPATAPFIDKSYRWVVGHIWTIGTTKINQASYGEVHEDLNFPNTFNPTGATQYIIMGGDGAGGSILDGPYRSAINAQGRTYPIPIIRDDFSWQKGKHGFQFGGTFKWPKPGGYTILNYDTPTIGLGGPMPGLDPDFEPANIFCQPGDTNCDESTAIGLYDPAFALALAPYTAVGSTFNYDAQGNPFPQGSGQTRTYRYYETELYFGDTWRMTPKLTLSYGVRWSNYSVPYEIHGIQSEQNTNFDSYFGARVAQSAASASGDSSVPLISYGLGGKANHAPGYFKPQYTNFAPRIAAAYQFNPKTVINGGIGIIYDQTVINAVQYQQSQFDYLFQASATQRIGFPNDPFDTLQDNPRFTGVDTPPAPPSAPTITKPFFPFVDSGGTPTGLGNGSAFNETVDPKLKTPYSIQLNFGIQHEIPGGFILKMSYAGRMGRRLLAQADANQLIEFKDPQSGQNMSNAFANIETELRSGMDPLSVPDEPWFTNQFPTPTVGFDFFGVGNNTQILTFYLNSLINRGDFADSIQALRGADLLNSNVGMGAQFSENTFYTNKGSSSYNGLLTTLHKNAGHGLQFDLNYTWAHSIDNVSLIANSAAFAGQGFVCDVLRPRLCRGNSDFDVTHYVNGDFIYDLPFGHGKALGASAPRWVDEAIGGWSVSGLPNWHSGNAYYAQTLAFVAGYANNAPAILTGSPSDLKVHLNGGKGQPLFGFADRNQANAAYTGPVGFNIGERNNLRGPSYFNFDLGLAKSFPIIGDRVALKFRADAFNALNHPNFNNPCADLTSLSCTGGGVFGQITSTVGTGINNAGPSGRVLQLALRLEF